MAELRKISDAELRAHSTPSDAWVAIAGDVYDVTRFLALHPGGETVLLPIRGRFCYSRQDDALHDTGKNQQRQCSNKASEQSIAYHAYHSMQQQSK